MKKQLLFLLVTVVLSTSACMFFTTKTYKNNDIDPDVKAEIAPLNKKVFDCLMADNVGGIKKLMSPLMLDSAGESIDTIVHTVAKEFKGKEYTMLDEFYTKHALPGNRVTLTANDGSINNYVIQYGALNHEMYASLFISKNLPINFAVFTVFGKYENGWKLNILSINNYSMLGKTAPEYYAKSMAEYHKGDTIDAALNIIVASALGSPGGKHFQYQDRDDMVAYYSSTVAEANSAYHFPITVKQIKTAPQIFTITPQLITDKTKEGIYPLIKYRSSVNIADTVALKAENNALQKVVGTMFKGIKQDRNYIMYEAFNQLPDGKTPVKDYGFVQRLP